MSLEDADNFVHLIYRYEKKLIAYIKRISNLSEEDAEDLLQEVFIKTYQNLNDFDQDLKFSSWIYRITHNHVINNYNKNKNKPKALSSDETELILDKISSDLDIPQDLDKKMKAKVIKSLINLLDEKYRDVLILKFIEDKDYTEISDILKKPMGTIATLINRAKMQLKELLIKNNITSSHD